MLSLSQNKWFKNRISNKMENFKRESKIKRKLFVLKNPFVREYLHQIFRKACCSLYVTFHLC